MLKKKTKKMTLVKKTCSVALFYLFLFNCSQAQDSSNYKILKNELQVSIIDDSILKMIDIENNELTYNLNGNDIFYSEPFVYGSDESNSPILITVEKSIDTYSFGIEVILYDKLAKQFITSFPVNISVIDPNVDQAIREDSPRRPDKFMNIYFSENSIHFLFDSDLEFYVDYGDSLNAEKINGKNLGLKYNLEEGKLSNVVEN